MTAHCPTTETEPSDHHDRSVIASVAVKTTATTTRAVRGTTFWLSIALPFAALALFTIGTERATLYAVGLLAGSAVTAYLGHSYCVR